jgi:hypothetical protein
MKSDAGKCVDLPNGNTDNGTTVQMYDCNDTEAQNFYFYEGEKFIRSAKSNGKCFDIPNGNAKAGQTIQMFDCNFTDSQKFDYDKNTKMFNAALLILIIEAKLTQLKILTFL